MALTDREVRSVKTPGILIDGAGLRLKVQVSARGGVRKSWFLRVKIANGPVRELGLGSIDLVSLAQAREKAAELRRLAKQGIDPLAQRQAERAEAEASRARCVSFRAAAEQFIQSMRPGWKNEKHAWQWTASLEAYVFPVFGSVAVSDVNTDLVLAALEPIWREKPETASRVRQRIEAILNAAKVRGLRTGENPAAWRGHLANLLPPPRSVRPVQHHAAVPIDDMPAFWQKLALRQGCGADALRLVILTAVRCGEARQARFGQFDLAKAVWTIPAEMMKGRRNQAREHRVPLSPPAVAIIEHRLAVARSREPHALVFESDLRQNVAVTDAALSAVMDRLGRIETVHGFRSTFRDWAAERTNFSHEAAEAALAHVVKNGVEAAYRRGDLFDKRRELMNAWADFVVGAADPATDQ